MDLEVTLCCWRCCLLGIPREDRFWVQFERPGGALRCSGGAGEPSVDCVCRERVVLGVCFGSQRKRQATSACAACVSRRVWGHSPPTSGAPRSPCSTHAKFSYPPQVAEHRVKLQELESLIANLGTGDETVTDQAFEDRLKEAEREVTDLLREAQEVKGIHDHAERL